MGALSSFYAIGLLVLGLGYSFFSDSNTYKISPELSKPQRISINSKPEEISSKLENDRAVDTIEIRLQLDDPDLLNSGEKIYRTHCAVCHGINLEGQKGWNIKDGQNNILAPPHDETGHTWHHSDKDLFYITKYGGAGKVGVASAMPGYEQILSDKKIISVLSFIKSTWPVQIRLQHDQINEQTVKK
ncbi:MAG: cytochrome C [Rhodospirillaceae bacterium]|nr:cytochrome C [Rhodospirillaceae bacterium]